MTGSENLSKREYFAALAMQALITNGFGSKNTTAKDCNGNVKTSIDLSQVSVAAIKMADTLIKDLEEMN